MPRFHFHFIALVCVLCETSACTPGTPASADGSNTATATASATGNSTDANVWVNNGATACDKYLTPDVVAEILTHPAGQSKKLSAQACAYKTDAGNIDITLTNGGLKGFNVRLQYLVDPVPLPGVGDKAVRSVGGIAALKGSDRGCSIHAGGAPGSTKLTGEALAQKLGAICNKLFALP